MEKLQLHPLITENEDGTRENEHYDSKEDNFIKREEAKYTVGAMIDWCSITIDKYEDRKDHKGQKKSDEAKIVKYKAYKLELQNLLSKSQTLKYVSVENAYKLLNIKWRY